MWSGISQCRNIRCQISAGDILTVCGRPASGSSRARVARKQALFCPICGVRLAHDSGPDSDVVRLKAGTLDDTSRLRPVAHLWTKRAPPRVDIDDRLLCYETQPDS